MVLLGLLVQEYQAIETKFTSMRFETGRLAPKTEFVPEPDLVFTNQLDHFIWFAKTEAHEGMSTYELQQMEKVAHRYLFSPALFRYALALALNDKYSEAHDELLLLRQLHTSERYAEAVNSWKLMEKNHPQLDRVTMPEPTPTSNHL